MAVRPGSSLRWIFPVALAVFLSVALTPISVPQERKNPQTAGVDNTVPCLSTSYLRRFSKGRVCNRSHSRESPGTNLGQG